jgi:hypothetical protein
MKKSILLLLGFLALSCSNSSKIEEKYWVEEKGNYIPEILYFKNNLMENLNKDKTVGYEIKDNSILIKEGATTLNVEIKEITSELMTLVVNNKIITYKEAVDSDFILGNWKSGDYKMRFKNYDGELDYEIEVNTNKLWKKKFSDNYEKDYELRQKAVEEAEKLNEEGSFTYTNGALLLNGKECKVKMSEDKKELTLELKGKSTTFKRY